MYKLLRINPLWGLPNVDKMWKTKYEKARIYGNFFVPLGRGGRVMSSSILYGLENKFVYMEYFSYLCIK